MHSSCEVQVETLKYGVMKILQPLPLKSDARLNIETIPWNGSPVFCHQLNYQTYIPGTDGSKITTGAIMYLDQPNSKNTLIIAQLYPLSQDAETVNKPINLGDDIMVYRDEKPDMLTVPGPFNRKRWLESTEIRGISFRGFSQALNGFNTGETIDQLKQANLGLNPEQFRLLLICFLEQTAAEQP